MVEYGDAAVAKFSWFAASVIAKLATDGQANHDAFAAAADAEHAAFEAFLEELVAEFALQFEEEDDHYSAPATYHQPTNQYSYTYRPYSYNRVLLD